MKGTWRRRRSGWGETTSFRYGYVINSYISWPRPPSDSLKCHLNLKEDNQFAHMHNREERFRHQFLDGTIPRFFACFTKIWPNTNNLSACCDHFWHMLPEPYNSSLGTRRFGAYSQEFMKKVEDRRFSNYDCNPKVRNCYQKRLTRPLEEIGTFASIHLFPWLPDLVKTFLLPLYTFRVPTDVPNMW